MSVDFPAPFSPRRAWIRPSSMVRSMWSFATRGPKRFVIPLSSSFTENLPLALLRVSVSGFLRRRGRGGVPHHALEVDYFGEFADSTLSSPLLIWSVSFMMSSLSSWETLESKSWKGAMETPPFSRVPT